MVYSHCFEKRYKIFWYMSWAQGCKTMLRGAPYPLARSPPSYVPGLMHEMDRPYLRIAVPNSQ